MAAGKASVDLLVPTGRHEGRRRHPRGRAAFPSTVAVVLTALLLGVVVRRYTGDRRALWTAFIFCTAGLVIASAKFCITDGVLLLFVAIGQACLALMYAADRRGKSPPLWAAPAFWISLGLAGLTKGPQPLGMHAITLLTLLLLDVAPIAIHPAAESGNGTCSGGGI